MKTMDLARLDELETIDPRPLSPWRAEPFTEIEVGSDQKTARERAEAVWPTSAIVVYSDASGRESHLGAAIVALDNNLEVFESQQVQVGPMDRWSVHVAELIEIFYAVRTVFKISHQRPRTEQNGTRTATILCDSRSALQAIQSSNKPGQRIIHAILQAATEAQATGIALRLKWIPGQCDKPGNDAADRLDKDMTSPGKLHPFRPLLSRRKALVLDDIRDQWRRE